MDNHHNVSANSVPHHSPAEILTQPQDSHAVCETIADVDLGCPIGQQSLPEARADDDWLDPRYMAP
jgi:hypothetical protein